MAQQKRVSDAVRKLELSSTERSVLLQACKDYRASLPSYLKARQAETKVLEELIRKLSQN